MFILNKIIVFDFMGCKYESNAFLRMYLQSTDSAQRTHFYLQMVQT